MVTKPTRATLLQALRQRDTEMATLRAQLAAPVAPISPGVGNPAGFLRQVQDLGAGLLLADAQGRISWASAAFLARCQCPLASLVGRSLADLPPTADGQATVAAQLAHPEAFALALPAPGPGPSRPWLRLQVQPLRGVAHGGGNLWLGRLEDITRARRAQAELVESEKYFRELAENAPVVLYAGRQDKTGPRRIVYCSPKLKEIFGIADVKDLSRFIHPEDQAATEASIGAAVAANAPVCVAFRLVVPGQPLRWCRASSTISGRDEDGVSYRGSFEDITLKKLAEEAARHDSLRGLLALEGLSIGSWEYHYATKRTTVSAECQHMLGYDDQASRSEHIKFADHMHPDESELLDKEWLACQNGEKELFACEHRVRCHDGTYKWVLSRGLITKRDERGRPLIFTGIIGDISARREAQQALATTTLRLTTTIQQLKRGVLLVDEDYKVVLTNHSFCQLFELTATPEELIGTKYHLLEAQIQRCIAQSVSELRNMTPLMAGRLERPNMFRLRSGRLVERDFVPIQNGDTGIGFLWKYEDITDSYQAENALRLSEEKYRTIIDNMELGLMEMDLDQRVLYVNPTYCAILGYSQQELKGRPLPPSLIPPESAAFLDKQLQKRRQGISNSYQISIVTKSGETKWLFSGAAPLYDQDHRVVGTIAVGLDITAQKQMEERLREAKELAEQSARAKEQFLANMSHEIRTPMNAILGMSQLLAKTPLAAQQSNYLHAITTSAENLLVIINDILDLSKLESGKMTLEQVGFNANRLCEQVKKTLLYKAEEKGLALTVKVSSLVPDVVLGDPYRVTQILLNLASNAVKFTEKGEVSIECEVIRFHQGAVELGFSVRDTGIGIDPEYLQRIFQEFSQEDPSITRQFGGTGLGLSISRSLARLMNSEIVIESVKNQGTDTSFIVPLPIGTVEDLPHRRPVSGISPQELRGKRILLVEDNEYNRLMAKAFLLNSHLNVTEAENGQAALDCVGQQAFDLILMDVQMPVMDGFEATRHLREDLGLTLPIIALTASAISGEKERCLAAGMDDYLTKPFYEDELLQLLCNWLLPVASPGEAVAAAPAAAPTMLYNLEVLQNMARGDQNFVSSMLQTFISSTQRTLQDLQTALAVGNLANLQAAAHKLRPSLRHLQIHSALELMDQLENWTGPFSYDDLRPDVETADRILRQVLIEMNAEQEKRRAAGH